MTEHNVATALTSALDHALASDSSVVVLGEDVGMTGGVFRITDGLQERHGAERVVDTPVAESGIVGAAFGMAVAGMRPVAELQFMGFSYPAYDQLFSHVSRIRNRSRHRFTAPLVVRIPYGGGIGAAEHHAESTESIYTAVPGLKVVVPSTPYDAKGLLLAAIADPDPVVFLEPIRLYRAIRQDIPDEAFEVPIGSASVVRPGGDVTLIAWGAMVRECTAAAEALSTEHSVQADVVDVRSLVPLDVRALVASVERTGRAVVVHEAPRSSGYAGEIIAELQHEALDYLEAPIERVTGFDCVVPLKRSEHQFQPASPAIVAAALQTFEP